MYGLDGKGMNILAESGEQTQCSQITKYIAKGRKTYLLKVESEHNVVRLQTYLHRAG
jgi:hypothetical protein